MPSVREESLVENLANIGGEANVRSRKLISSQGQSMTVRVICIERQIYGCSALCDNGDDLWGLAGQSHTSFVTPI
jgi:hypothetical protein